MTYFSYISYNIHTSLHHLVTFLKQKHSKWGLGLMSFLIWCFFNIHWFFCLAFLKQNHSERGHVMELSYLMLFQHRWIFCLRCLVKYYNIQWTSLHLLIAFLKLNHSKRGLRIMSFFIWCFSNTNNFFLAPLSCQDSFSFMTITTI